MAYKLLPALAASATLFASSVAFAQTVDKTGDTLSKIGDCNAPGLIAAAVYAGHRYARELEEPEGAAQPLRDRAWQGL